MNIGFFGDSYVDLVWYRYLYTPAEDQKIWAQRLSESLNASTVASGLGGSNQYHAIHTWNMLAKKPDVAFFTFTWYHRLFSNHPSWQKILSACAENRSIFEDEKKLFKPGEAERLIAAHNEYYALLHDDGQAKFNFEQQVRWCLELPKQYPDTKFIFLPNTEHARTLSQKYFTEGVLFDFAFEHLSATEGDLPGVSTYDPNHIGHLSPLFHSMFTMIAKEVVVDYERYRNKLYQFDYEPFGLSAIDLHK